jgi:hypothetical protein
MKALLLQVGGIILMATGLAMAAGLWAGVVAAGVAMLAFGLAVERTG